MRITVIKGAELSSEDVDRWRSFQLADPSLASPYFCPEFTQAVAAVRNDVFVGRLEEEGEVVGYFPYQRRLFGFGSPVGGSLCDYHGVIARRGATWIVAELMRACRLVSWDFHALVASQEPFAAHHAEQGDSHFLDVQDGLEGYYKRLKEAGSSQRLKLGTTRRKLEREFRNVEFIANLDQEAALDLLLGWKSKQYQAAGIRDNFSYRWVVRLLHRIRTLRSEHFSGMLSVLKADGKVAALHFGIRSKSVWHWWFPRHDEEFSRFKPGLLLLVYAVEHAPKIGVSRIELGYGDEAFKLRLRTGGIPVARGRVEVSSAAVTLLRCREGIERWVRASPFYGIARVPGRLITRLEGWNRMR
jgi:CelD/BcsL family acetyltransferase involved in cellulose biosynthesis